MPPKLRCGVGSDAPLAFPLLSSLFIVLPLCLSCSTDVVSSFQSAIYVPLHECAFDLHISLGCSGSRQLQPQLSLPVFNPPAGNRQAHLIGIAQTISAKDNAYMEAFLRQQAVKGKLTDGEINEIRSLVSVIRGEAPEPDFRVQPYRRPSQQSLVSFAYTCCFMARLGQVQADRLLCGS